LLRLKLPWRRFKGKAGGKSTLVDLGGKHRKVRKIDGACIYKRKKPRGGQIGVVVLVRWSSRWEKNRSGEGKNGQEGA